MTLQDDRIERQQAEQLRQVDQGQVWSVQSWRQQERGLMLKIYRE